MWSKRSSRNIFAESNRLAHERDRDDHWHRQELKGITAGIERLTAAILKGVNASLVCDEPNGLDRRKATLEECWALVSNRPSP